MIKKQLGLNKHQKAARKAGEARVSGEEIEELLVLSCSTDPAERAVAAQFMCPCHVRRRVDAVWDALFRMMEDPDVRVRRNAWHTLEDGGRPDDPRLDALIERLYPSERDPQVRRFLELFAQQRQAHAEVELRRAAQPINWQRGKCDFCGAIATRVKTDYTSEIVVVGRPSRFGLICEQCTR